MAFPSSDATVSLEPVWAAFQGHAARAKRKAAALRAATLAPCTAALILGTVRDILAARDAMQALAATPGLEAYAREQINNPALNLVAEYNAMIAAINAVRDWVSTNIPKDGTGYLLIQTISTELVVTDREFSSVSLGGLRTVLDTLIAAIA